MSCISEKLAAGQNPCFNCHFVFDCDTLTSQRLRFDFSPSWSWSSFIQILLFFQNKCNSNSSSNNKQRKGIQFYKARHSVKSHTTAREPSEQAATSRTPESIHVNHCESSFQPIKGCNSAAIYSHLSCKHSSFYSCSCIAREDVFWKRATAIRKGAGKLWSGQLPPLPIQ